MKLTLLLSLVLIGLVAGDNAWKQNYEYKYKLMTKILTEFNDQWVGAISRARLSIYPQSEDLLICEISEAESAEVKHSRKWDSHLNDNELSYNQLPLSKPFEIHLKNCRIDTLSVDRSMTHDQINQLKDIVSQFQVDANSQNVLTLESMQQSTRRPEIQAGSLLNIGNLNFNKNLQYDSQNRARPLVTSNVETVRLSNVSADNPPVWSGCYTRFVSASSMCLWEYSPEWVSVGTEGCGFLGLGHRAQCVCKFPGCEATYCYSPVIGSRCEKAFGDRLPVRKGNFDDCSPGFIRDRCCPKSYQ